MKPDDVLFWLRAMPFVPFRITTNSGRTYVIKHSELVQVMTGSVIVYTPSDKEGVMERGEMIGLALIDHIEPVDQPAKT